MVLQVLLAIASSSVVSMALAGFIIWVSRSWLTEKIKNSVKNQYDERLETHKFELKTQSDSAIETLRAELKAKTDLETERLRSQLSILASEHQIRFSNLHQQRAEIIAETYANLIELYNKMGAYVAIFEAAGGPSRAERRASAVRAHEAFRIYSSKAVFFPKNIATTIESIDKDIVNAFNEFSILVDGPNQDTARWMQIFERLGGEIKHGLDELGDAFRIILGDREPLEIKN